MTYSPRRDAANVYLAPTVNTTLTKWNRTVAADAALGQMYVELASAVNNAGKEIEIAKTDASNNRVAVIGALNGVVAIPLAAVTTSLDSLTVTSAGLFAPTMVDRLISAPGVPVTDFVTVESYIDANTITISQPAAVGAGAGAGQIELGRQTINKKSVVWIESQNSAISVRSDGTNSVIFDDASRELRPGMRIVTGNYTAKPTDEYLLLDASGGAFTVKFPLMALVATASRTKSIKCKKIDTTANGITMTAQGLETVEVLDSNPPTYATSTLIDVPGDAWDFVAQIATQKWHIAP
jgi:hypothetical protein